MKIYNYILIILFSLNSVIYAQVGINTENIHNKAIMDIQNPHPEDKNKSMVLKYPSVEDIIHLPKYDAGEPDLFEDDANMTGMLMYVKNKKELYYYDGKTWLPVVNINGNETKARYDGRKGFPCVLGICGDEPLQFSTVISDGLNITSPTSGGNFFKIAETSIYEISVSLQIQVQGLAITNAMVKLKTLVNDSERNVASAIARHFLINAGEWSNYMVNYSYLIYLKQGDVVRWNVEVPYNAGLVGLGVYLQGGNNTYITFRRVL